MSAASDVLEEHASQFVTDANQLGVDDPVRDSYLDAAAELLSAARRAR